MAKLTADEIAYLRSMPSSDFQQWISDLAAHDEQAAINVLREVDESVWVTDEKNEIADFFDVAPETVDLWTRKGMPYRSRGRGSKALFDFRECSRWLASQKVIQPEANDEQAKADREYREEKRRIAELQRKKLEGSLVDSEQYRRVILSTVTMIRRGVEAFHKAYGNEAVQMLTEIVNEAENNINLGLDSDE